MVYDSKGEVYDPTYSSSILNRYINQRAGLTFSWQKEKINAQLGAQVNPTNTHNETNGQNYDSKVVNWSPEARIRYTFSDNMNMMLFYNGRSSQPSTSQLMPVPDNSNPLNISLGNPYLEPYFNHNIRGRFGYTNKKTFTSINLNLRATMVENAITSAQWYDSYGRQYSIPVNGPTTVSLNGRLFINSPIGKSGFSIFSMSFANYNESVSYIGTDSFKKLDSDKYYDPEEAVFDYDLFHKDFPDLEKASDKFTKNNTQTVGFTQRLRFTYRNDFVELNLGGRTRMSKSWYTIQNANPQTT
jgi:hypothetical protein